MKVEDCKLCSKLVESRKQIVNGYGTGKSGIMFIGEAPGQAGSNITGEPFSHGRCGIWFNDILKEMNIDKKECRTLNLVMCSPEGNRKPTNEEINNCLPNLKKEIEEFKPKVIVTLGKIPRENVEKLVSENTKFVPLYHPGFILRVGTREIIDEFKKKLKEVKRMSEYKIVKTVRKTLTADDVRKDANLMRAIKDTGETPEEFIIRVQAERKKRKKDKGGYESIRKKKRVKIELKDKLAAISMLTSMTAREIATKLDYTSQQIRAWRRAKERGKLE